MWRWATCSSPASRAAAVLGCLCAGAGVADAQARLTQQEALRLAFPAPAAIERHTAFLTSEQVARARRLAGPDVDVRTGVVTYYTGTVDGRRLGVAYFDSHRVRTLREVLMIVVDTTSQIGRIEVLRFDEPPEYLVRDGWMEQLLQRDLSDALSLKRGIVNMTGATLTSRAIVAAARRVLALHQVIRP